MDQLRKIYVEVTTACVLQCRMCVRHFWHELTGTMSLHTFRTFIDQVRALPELPTIHFSGYGEPMMHPDILEFIRLAKSAGCRVELTTSGARLNRIVSSALIDLDLDKLNVSIDGVTPEQYEDIRTGGSFDQVIDNLRDLWRLKMRRGGKHSNPQVAISFVAMKRNVGDLPLLPRLASLIGAWEVQVTNIIPHTPELEREILYERSLRAPAYRASRQVPALSLPKLDLNEVTALPLVNTFNSRASISLLDANLSDRANYCRFAHEGYAALRWDGTLHPCLSLMHDHPEYIRGRRKQVMHYELGNIHEQPLGDLWASDEYAAFRERVRCFPFSPCTTCGGCERFAGNQVDCSEQTYPTCGGCLWAQGLIQCP
jgi:MoaA/NifB/PqqE/SkfB family radical SAM enzyme